MSRADVIAQVAVLKAAFPRESIPQETLAVYATKLSDIETSLLVAAVNRLVEQSRFWPTISEVRGMAARLAGLLPPSAAEAMAIVRRADVRTPVYRRDGSLAYTESFWEWPEDAPTDVIELCLEVIRGVGDPVDRASGKDHFAWDTGFKQVYEAKAEEASRDVLADLSGARLLTAARLTLLGSGDEVAT